MNENNFIYNLEYKYEDEVKKIIEETEKKHLNKIHNQIEDLNEIGNDLNILLKSDKENLEQINKNVNKTEDIIIKTNIELTDTLKYKISKKRMATITTFAVLGIAGGGITAPILGVQGLGSILGISLGSGLVGGVLGKGLSKVII
jgi:t-SNARE complex subunit (syntaxin)